MRGSVDHEASGGVPAGRLRMRDELRHDLFLAHVVLQPVTVGSPILARESRSMRLSFLVELGQTASECCIPALALPPPLESRFGFPELQEMGIHRVRRAVLWEGASHGAVVALELVGPSSYV
ncbi:hypothetical protein HPB49_004514 [Dermacentor silvarum]|uniref:Uncharacterized protein n=1 Tax=Dermacentor silvarum TaxID=543639 RepID=A0ACB8CPW8_DERSI|nr:hypothetical protein HPB49_004514 [Dermacentor silvarum]